ncbi:MAG: nucleotidyltransferase domain-containing protein [Nitrospirae bacterium]|nr:nucleotidyltransferase domain-containing protein [Nitrospirota bacterium]MCL5237245.1 nucleotidyltransferase domain-containing protein [Nitrospirota bacterium]
MVKTEREIKIILNRYAAEIVKLGVTPQAILLYGSYARGNAREDSDIDVIIVSEDFKNMNLRERLELLGLAAGRVFEPIEAIGYTPDELRGTFLEEALKVSSRI